MSEYPCDAPHCQNTSSIACTRCHRASYCSTACAAKSWVRHANHCEAGASARVLEAVADVDYAGEFDMESPGIGDHYVKNMYKKLSLAKRMLLLTTEHVELTHTTMLAAVYSLNTLLEQNLEELTKNQDRLGELLGEILCNPRHGDEITKLLKMHIELFVEWVGNKLEQNEEAAATSAKNLYQNGDEIADYLYKQSHNKLPMQVARDEFKRHLDLTVEEATAMMAGAETVVQKKLLARDHMNAFGMKLMKGLMHKDPKGHGYERKMKGGHMTY